MRCTALATIGLGAALVAACAAPARPPVVAAPPSGNAGSASDTAPATAPSAQGPTPFAAATTSDDAAFEATVRPILRSRCAPCHETGGKMYERMPFDRPATILAHEAGVLRRIDDPEEKALLEAWLRARR